MEEATVVDVISTRFYMAKSEKAKKDASEKVYEQTGTRTTSTNRATPSTAGNVKRELEGGQKYKQGDEEVEDSKRRDRLQPEYDNAYLMKGDPEAANAIWLLNWRKALEKREEDGWPLRANHSSRAVCLKCRRRRRAWRRIRASRS